MTLRIPKAVIALAVVALLAVAAYAQRMVTISTLAANLLQADQQTVSVAGEIQYVRYSSNYKGEQMVSLTLQEPETKRQVTIYTKAQNVGINLRVGQPIKVTGKFEATRSIGAIKID